MRFFVFFIVCISVCFAQYKTLDDALLNGEKLIDIVLYGNYMSSNGNTGYYPNNLYGENKLLGNGGYINASVGLGYTTGFYYNMRAAISFRAAQAIFSPSNGMRRDFFNNTGNAILGDSSIALGESFLEYYDGDTAIKAGRFQPISEWVNHLIDGIWFRNASFKNFVLELIWAYNYGRVSYYEISQFRRLDTTGWFNLGIHYHLTGDKSDRKNSTSMSVFSTFIPGVFATAGARLHWALRFNNSVWWIGADLGFAGSFEDSDNIRAFQTNTFLFDSKITLGYRNIDGMIGYVATGDAGMGSLGILGVGNGTQSNMLYSFYNNIQPFFVWGGRAIKMGKNAHLVYGALRLNLLDGKLNAYVAYGATFFNGSQFYGGNINGLVQGELNVMAEFGITRTLSAIANISNTHFGKYGLPNTFEINGGIRFMF